MLEGRPPIFNNVEELQKKIEEYLKDCPDKKTMYFKLKDEVEEREIPCPTITGLALFLGFESRQSFYDYEKREQFSYTIKRARTFIEREYEQLLQTGNPTGAIFALKNFGWKDKSDLDITSGGKPIYGGQSFSGHPSDTQGLPTQEEN
jgi:hypothetical protein